MNAKEMGMLALCLNSLTALPNGDVIRVMQDMHYHAHQLRNDARSCIMHATFVHICDIKV